MNRPILFLLFFVSGFCSLVYEVVWTRLAFASFGIITPVLSVVLSVFMLGLSVGSWAGGRWVEQGARRTGWSAARFYALAELLVGLGAFAVPHLFKLGETLLLSAGQSNSFAYLSLSALVLAAAIFPWCVCMGATFPLVMAYIREQCPRSIHGFSYLYLANVLGAMGGTLLTAFVLVELFGFDDTLHVAAAGNFMIAVIGWTLGRGRPAGGLGVAPVDAPNDPVQEPAQSVHPVNAVYDRVCLHGNGSDLDARLQPGTQDPGLFFCTGGGDLPGCHLRRFAALPLAAPEGGPALDRRIAGPVVRLGFPAGSAQ